MTTTIDWDKLQSNGICLLCGKEMDERFYSGSYETYLTCGCEHRKQLAELDEKVRQILNLADTQIAEMQRVAKAKKMYAQLEHLDPDRRLDPKRKD